MKTTISKSIRKVLATILMLALLLSLDTAVYAAEDIQGVDSVTNKIAFAETAEINYLERVLPYFIAETEKDWGLYDFYIGSKLKSYYCCGSDILTTAFSTYPVYKDDAVCAIVFVFGAENNDISCQYTTYFAESLNELLLLHNPDRIAIIHAADGIWLVSDSGKCELIFEQFVPDNQSSFQQTSLDKLFQTIELTECKQTSNKLNMAVCGMRTVYTDTLYVPGITQGNLPLCWAACAASIGAYLTGISLTAVQFANICGQTSGNYHGLFTDQMLPFFNQTYDLDYVQSTSALTFTKVETDIYHDYPIYVTGRRPATGVVQGRHAIVVNGYVYNSATEFYSLMFMDPINGIPYNYLTMPSSGRFSFTRTDGNTYTQEDYATGVHY